ncbi:MAG: OB-fold nucleic acid binding domain-containing protein [Candidatus Hydrothermarchaeaceae archaeon]
MKVRIKDITSGKFKKEGSEWESYLLTPLNEKAARVRVLATVVSKFVSDNGKYANISLDDATDTITSRAFDDSVKLIESTKEGDIVDVIGRVKEYKDEKYISAESVSQIVDPNWELVRKLELALKIKELGGATSSTGEEDSSKNPKLIVIRHIEEFDNGDGVKYVRLLNETGFNDEKLEKILTELMEEGDIYEPKIGKFKRV